MENKDLLPSGQARIEHLELCNITKRFPGVLANDRVCFDVRAGEVHALLGENGAGKSTLMKVLYGLDRPDEGEILLNGQPVQIHSPTDAIRLGIGMIHQIVKRLELDRAINQAVPIFKIYLPYSESNHELNIAYNPLAATPWFSRDIPA